MSDDLLPPSATKQEKSLSGALSARVDKLPVDIKKLWNPETCPVSLLPVLAWSLSVDEWQEAWTEAQKRSVCKCSTDLHAIKGSRKAVERAVEQLGAGIVIKEWWEQSPQGKPHTFQVVVVGGSATGGSIKGQSQLKRLIDNAKPLRSHYTMSIGTEYTTPVYLTSRQHVSVISRGTFG